MGERQKDEAENGGRRPQTRFSRRALLLLGAAGLAGLMGWQRLQHGGAKGRGTGLSAPLYDFPVLNIEGGPPAVAARDWVLSVDGLVAQPLRLDRAAWLALPRTQETIDLHCVEGWTAPNLRWGGVSIRDLLHRVMPRPEGRFVSFHAFGGNYAKSLTLEEAMAPESMLADGLDGAPLSAFHGGPLRLVIPTRMGYKNVKWVTRVEISAQPHNKP
jgi:DMSO/TMAO reductase YedYZ molybdopterin-dependent catalytic subunit